MTLEPRYTFDRVVRLIISALVLVGVFALLRYLSDVLLPFAIAVVLAYLLNPLVTLFEQRLRRRWAAVAMTLAGIVILGAALVVILVPVVIQQSRRFARDLELLQVDASTVTPATATDQNSADVPILESESPHGGTALGWTELQGAWDQYLASAGSAPRRERIRRMLDAISGTMIGDAAIGLIRFSKTDEFRQWLFHAAKTAAIGGWTVVAFAVNLVLGLTALILVMVYLVFLLLDFPLFARSWKDFLPPTYRDVIVEFLVEFNKAMRRYFRGQSVVAMCTGSLMAVGLTLIGLPLAIPFGLFVGLLSMVPYLQILTLVPAMMLAVMRAIEGESSVLMSVALTLLVYVVVQVTQDSLITPRIMGKATGLRPISILLGVFIWGKLLGFLGVLLAIPLTCLGIAYYRRYVLHRAPKPEPPN